MTYYEQLSGLIGHTPLLKIPTNYPNWLVLGKMEIFNPGGSIKDRSALGLIIDAENKGLLKKGMTIVESTSGNTGIALAMLAAERGYKFIAVADSHGLKEKLDKIKALGAELYLCDTSELPSGQVGTDIRRDIAQQLAQTNDDYICLNQYDNPANPEFYYHTLGTELLEGTSGEIDVLIGAVGTGSALSGAARRLKQHTPNIQIYAVEPEGSISFGKEGKVYYQSGPGFPAGATLPQNIDYSVIDQDYQISDSATFHTLRFMARRHGLFLGDSAGAALYQTMKFIQQQDNNNTSPKTLVVVICDSGQYYLSHAYNDEWMQEMNLFEPAIETELAAFYG